MIASTSQCAKSGRGTPMFSRRGKSTIPKHGCFSTKDNREFGDFRQKKKKFSKEPIVTDDIDKKQKQIQEIEEVLKDMDEEREKRKQKEIEEQNQLTEKEKDRIKKINRIKNAKQWFKKSKQNPPAPNQYFKDIFRKVNTNHSSLFGKGPKRQTDPSMHGSFFVVDKRKSKLYILLKKQKSRKCIREARSYYRKSNTKGFRNKTNYVEESPEPKSNAYSSSKSKYISPSRINLSTSKSNYTLATFGDLTNPKQRNQCEKYYYDSMKSINESPSVSAEVQSITSGLKAQKKICQPPQKMRNIKLMEYGQNFSTGKHSNQRDLSPLSKFRASPSRSIKRPKTALFHSQKTDKSESKLSKLSMIKQISRDQANKLMPNRTDPHESRFKMKDIEKELSYKYRNNCNIYINFGSIPKNNSQEKLRRKDVERGKANEQKLYYDIDLEALKKPISVPNFEKYMPRDDRFLINKCLDTPCYDFSDEILYLNSNKIIPMDKQLSEEKVKRGRSEMVYSSLNNFQSKMKKLHGFLESSFK
ncbi:unnamed protein product [Moneuplotes crassus]|uniref:Uncharacterized protein n=1 Tax=Euplotes crassus TaxID=5936 RepID=A0AAD1U4P2_EUPCR|nr:unnamed protein product [Moneuplotes crassus]